MKREVIFRNFEADQRLSRIRERLAGRIERLAASADPDAVLLRTAMERHTTRSLYGTVVSWTCLGGPADLHENRRAARGARRGDPGRGPPGGRGTPHRGVPLLLLLEREPPQGDRAVRDGCRLQDPGADPPEDRGDAVGTGGAGHPFAFSRHMGKRLDPGPETEACDADRESAGREPWRGPCVFTASRAECSATGRRSSFAAEACRSRSGT
jgi:hypothetical protein